MNEISRVCQGLSVSRPSLDPQQLLALIDPSPEFEAHIPAETGKDAWIYTVNGKTLEGECLVVRATWPWQAETLAQEGLADTIAALRKLDQATGLSVSAEAKPYGAH